MFVTISETPFIDLQTLYFYVLKIIEHNILETKKNHLVKF